MRSPHLYEHRPQVLYFITLQQSSLADLGISMAPTVTETVTMELAEVSDDESRPLLNKADSFSSVRSAARRHSFHSHSKSPSTDLEFLEEVVLLKLDLFLSHLEQRLHSLESYSAEKLSRLDESLVNAYQTLVAVKESCGKLGGEVIGEGWRRGEAIVTILERRYNDSLTTKDSLPSKVAAGMHFLEQKLSDLEGQCYTTVNETIQNVDTKLSDSADAINRSIEAALRAAKERLITYEELPLQWRENPYIYRGYRFCANYTECVVSLVKIHNETCNIWTHGFGFIMMLSVALYYYPSSPDFKKFTMWDKVVFGIFLVAALKCLLSSMIWHTFNSIGILSHKRYFACVDYTGISVLIACSILTTQYTSFYCQPLSQTVYMTSTALFGIVGAVMAWHPAFDEPENRWLRITLFVSLAMSGALGLVQLSFTKGIINTLTFYFPISKSLLCYVAGVVVYGCLFPEKYFPGSIFDWIGASHNIWHLAVVGGIYYHYTATHKLLEDAREFSCAAH
ncbi:hemolysin-III related-domain-containing protein [Lipomyces tetrasporus]|uniref:Hemolysin-III related-domain-containing protein n=1 Tax=Lipomyces tetrasporus TaxID=54092 RepID=A0AAD7QKC1_9ASCO|nr:hemolysin-III related-domain-containing protein [Lipomyces tetrasporus]KAJ8096830.1 hemolysin-III related-domain-containing protein [Lipomyces tetrasporus]